MSETSEITESESRFYKEAEDYFNHKYNEFIFLSEFNDNEHLKNVLKGFYFHGVARGIELGSKDIRAYLKEALTNILKTL